MTKYVSKGFHEENNHPLTLPTGVRIYGVGGLDALQRDEKAWWMSPAWVREIWSILDGLENWRMATVALSDKSHRRSGLCSKK